VKPILFLVGVLVATVLTASAQDAKPLAPRTQDWHSRTLPADLFFCPPKTCLYYSGDFDTKSPNLNGLFDFFNPPVGIGEVWVGVRPRKNATVTGTAGNYFTTAGGFGINPTPFVVQTGITAGHAGKTVCETSGNAAVEQYGICTGFGNCWNYYISKLKKSCKLKKGKMYFILMQPQYDETLIVGYLWDDDGQQANKRGWPEIKDKSYFNSLSFGADYQPTWGSNGACVGIGCDGFSISLTGTEK
jgi:hypothetical protein